MGLMFDGIPDEGVKLDPDMLIGVLNQRVAQAVVREAQFETAIMQLQNELLAVRNELATYKDAVPVAKDPSE